jgi:diguanylate cyclase (GGDEF)-like protein
MPSLDLRGVILLAGVMGALMSLVIYFMRRGYPSSIGGLGYWALGPGVAFLSTLLFGARGILPELLTVTVANLLLLLAVFSLYFGSGRFYRQTIDARRWLAAIGVVIGVTGWYTFVQPNYNARLMLIAIFMGFTFTRHALLVARHGGKSFAARFTLLVLATEAVVLFLRAASALTTESADLLQSSPIQSIYITAYAVTMLMLTVGLVLLAADRLRCELEHLATHDPLTGIFTRRALLDSCALELARCLRHDRTMALLMLDLDHFKAVNDHYGHLVGDQVILNFVARTGGLLRQIDSFGRYGGEEFVVLLPETNAADALVVAERIRAAVATPSELPAYTVSIGITTRSYADTKVDELLARADQALYQAKANGRNRIEMAGLSATESIAAAG